MFCSPAARSHRRRPRWAASSGQTRGARPHPSAGAPNLSPCARCLTFPFAALLCRFTIPRAAKKTPNQNNFVIKRGANQSQLHPSPTDIANQPLLSRPNRDRNLFENTTQTKHQKCSLLRSCGFSQRPLAFWGKGKADGSEAPKGTQTTKGTQTNQPSTSVSVKEPA